MIQDEEFNKKVDERIKKLVPEYLKRSAFKDRKLTDTPTDDLQVVNKRYCDANSAGVAGNDKDIQFNDGGIMAGDDSLQWNKSLNFLIVGNYNSVGVVTGVNLTTDLENNGASEGGSLSLEGGDGNVNGNGGDVQLSAGTGGSVDGDGGAIVTHAGSGGSTHGDGGTVEVWAGYSLADGSTGGDLDLEAGYVDLGPTAGDNGGADGGDVYLGSGAVTDASTYSTSGDIEIEVGVLTSATAVDGMIGGNIDIKAGNVTAFNVTGNTTNGQAGSVSISAGRRITNGGATSDAIGGDINLVVGTGATNGNLNISNLPTSSAGLSSGDIWLNSNVLTIVP
jgi:hypothetical protein